MEDTEVSEDIEVSDRDEHADVGESPARRPRRRGRTALLIACAAALGVVAGTCAGYVVQAGRAPDPLPPLSQPVVPQSKGKAPEPLSAARDRKVRTDGDLRKLLVKRPKGATDLPNALTPDRWQSVLEMAEMYTHSDTVFTQLVEADFRRAALDGWREDGTMVSVRLRQYRDEATVASAEAALYEQGWAEGRHPSTVGRAIPGSGTGQVYVHAQPEREAGYIPLYTAEAYASRGDILMEVSLVGPRPISKKRAMQVARQQWERL
ncbi:hypothetical protein OG698_25440 [Streptomyces sp. NBC_01003]|uniref:hypothetical protein n=1 Tax=Streptomyces sp. NBC_01003 TaxID=2903714 RepID=UPI00386E863A|nr:hypothetical protein OG698_25440 [Streptomyces sp. NBC_01003]